MMGGYKKKILNLEEFWKKGLKAIKEKSVNKITKKSYFVT